LIKIPFNEQTINKAKEFAANLGCLKNSITSGSGNKAGYLGELALSEYLGATLISNCDFNSDILFQGKKIEVKTKRRSRDPRPDYEVSVAETSKHQRPDIYAFISITFKKVLDIAGKKRYKEPQSIWLCGFYDAEKYFLDAKKIKKGARDKSNNFTCHCDMYNLGISKLKIVL
jgi:hypothetical protein